MGLLQLELCTRALTQYKRRSGASLRENPSPNVPGRDQLNSADGAELAAVTGSQQGLPRSPKGHQMGPSCLSALCYSLTFKQLASACFELERVPRASKNRTLRFTCQCRGSLRTRPHPASCYALSMKVQVSPICKLEYSSTTLLCIVGDLSAVQSPFFLPCRPSQPVSASLWSPPNLFVKLWRMPSPHMPAASP